MQELERPASIWPARKARVVYKIFMLDQASRDDVTFIWNGGERRFTPGRGVSINGDSQEGMRPSYWVILAFRRGADGSVICNEGYAHAFFLLNCPVPVDTGLDTPAREQPPQLFCHI